MRFVPHKKDQGLCIRHGCRRKHGAKSPLCPRHAKHVQKEKNLLSYTFNVRKNNALRRGISWELTLEEFAAFCQETGYLATKGRKADASTLDRIRSNEGYHKDNIQILSCSLNSAKGNRDECPF
jgi:hypothetical protein